MRVGCRSTVGLHQPVRARAFRRGPFLYGHRRRARDGERRGHAHRRTCGRPIAATNTAARYLAVRGHGNHFAHAIQPVLFHLYQPQRSVDCRRVALYLTGVCHGYVSAILQGAHNHSQDCGAYRHVCRLRFGGGYIQRDDDHHANGTCVRDWVRLLLRHVLDFRTGGG